MINDLRQKMFWDEILLVPLCTDTRVLERENRVVIESDRVAVWIPFPTSILWFVGRIFGATRTAKATRWTASTKDSMVTCLCREIVNRMLPVMWKWLTLAAAVPWTAGNRKAYNRPPYLRDFAWQCSGNWQKAKAIGSKVWWHWLRRWEQSVCCGGDAPPRWPWPWKMTDAFWRLTGERV